MANPTVQQIIDRALDRSGLSDFNLINVPASISVISTEQRRVFLMAATMNPDYFGTDSNTSARNGFADPWDLDTTPGNVAAVTLAKVAAMNGNNFGCNLDDRVNLVGIRWPGLDVSPRAYLRGRKIVPYNTELGANNNNFVTTLKLYYAPLPAVLAATTTSLELPDEWSPLLVLPLARMFAVRDKRDEEVPFIDAEYQGVLSTFQTALLAYGHGMRRPLQQVPALPLGLVAPSGK